LKKIRTEEMARCVSLKGISLWNFSKLGETGKMGRKWTKTRLVKSKTQKIS